MENPFVKLVREGDESSAEDQVVVETSYDNQGDYWEVYGRNEKGDEVMGTRKRLDSRPEDRESLEAEYGEYRKEFGLDRKDLDV